MSRDDELALVLEVACQVEDRAPEEQRAMLGLALRLDVKRGRFTVTNHAPRRPELVYRVMESCALSPMFTKAQQQRFNRLTKAWEPCPDCKEPLGAHTADGCPRVVAG